MKTTFYVKSFLIRKLFPPKVLHCIDHAHKHKKSSVIYLKFISYAKELYKMHNFSPFRKFAWYKLWYKVMHINIIYAQSYAHKYNLYTE